MAREWSTSNEIVQEDSTREWSTPGEIVEETTAVAGGDPEGCLIGGKLVGGGLLMRGILK